MKKWKITDIKFNRDYKGYVRFRVWDKKYYCEGILCFIDQLVFSVRDKIKGKNAEYKYMKNYLKGADFYLHREYEAGELRYWYEVEMINSLLFPDNNHRFFILTYNNDSEYKKNQKRLGKKF